MFGKIYSRFLGGLPTKHCVAISGRWRASVQEVIIHYSGGINEIVGQNLQQLHKAVRCHTINETEM